MKLKISKTVTAQGPIYLRFSPLLTHMALLFLLSGCGVYSFTGVTTTAKSIFIGNFYSRIAGGPPNIGQDFTEQLKEYYQRNSSLSIADESADLSVTGFISRYEVTPVAATAQDRAAQNRLTIAVEVDFVDTTDEKNSFTQTFSFYSDFPDNVTLSQVEQEKITEIFEQLVLDIFTRTLANW